MEQVLEIVGVGIAMDELNIVYSEGHKIINGTATIISEVEDEEFYDEFKFSYTTDDDFLDMDIEQDFWKDYIETIEDILRENIKTNILNNKNN